MEKQVLIADDDPSIITLLNSCLVSAGYTVLTARNGREALERIREHRPSLVMADWTMPEMDGLELCQAIRADKSLGYIYLLMLTGRSDKGEIVEALDAGADDHVSKPFDRGELLAHVRAGERIVRLERQAAERSRLESERNRLREAVAAMEQVIGVIGHEIRTPLAGLRATTEFLLRPEARQLSDTSRFIRSMHDELIRLSDTANNLLEAARINSGNARWTWSTFELGSLCTQAMDPLRPLIAGRPIELTAEVCPPGLSARGDSAAIRRLLINLLSNSCRNTEQGSIRIRCRLLEELPRSWIQIEVIDTGRGIAPKIAAGLGEAFALNQGAVGDRHVNGTGLGLAICRGIVAAHGGSIRIDSAVGRGTTVTVRIRDNLDGPMPHSPDAQFIRSIAA